MTGVVCQTCLADNPAGVAFCTQCGRQLTQPAPGAAWGAPAPDDGATVFTRAAPSRQPQSQPYVQPQPQPQPQRQPAPAELAPRPRRLLWIAAIGLPLLAIVTGVALVVALSGCRGDGCSDRPGPSTVGPAAVVGVAAAPSSASVPTPLPPSPGSARQVAPGQPTVSGRHVFIPLTISAPADQPVATCTATVKAQESAFACTDGKYEYDADYGSNEAVTIKVANAAGAATIASVPVEVPLYKAVVIHACSPPPCEPVSTHQAPHRNTNEEPSLVDGTALEIECWTQGDAYQTSFVVPGQPTRTTQVFYRLRSPAAGRYLWAPFVVEDFEQPVPGVAPC